MLRVVHVLGHLGERRLLMLLLLLKLLVLLRRLQLGLGARVAQHGVHRVDLTELLEQRNQIEQLRVGGVVEPRLHWHLESYKEKQILENCF